MSSKYYDTSAAMQVIGCILQKPSLLDDEGKFFFHQDDFDNPLHEVCFGAIYNLYKMGAKRINIETIYDYLKDRPESLVKFEKHNGATWLKENLENTDLQNFEYNYNTLKKMTLLRGYDNFGLSVRWIYDPDNINDPKKKKEQKDYFDSLSLEDVANLIDDKVLDLRSKYVDNASEDSVLIGEGILELISDLEKTPEVGSPLFDPIVNTITRGARLKKFYLRSGQTGLGKAIVNSVDIPTPNGWEKVGNIKVGDYLFDKNGKPTEVLAVYPQAEKKQVYRVKFLDGRYVDCCKDHLWTYYFRSHGVRKIRTETTEEILKRTANGFQTNQGDYKIKVPLNEPVEYSQKEYLTSPYIMGALLGDGSFRYNKRNKSLSFSSNDEEIVARIAKELKCKYKKAKSNNYNWYFYTDKSNRLWVEEILQEYPKLWNAKSENKFIPKDYLMGSIEQRFELLQGLMDTDGSIDSKGRISFHTVSPQLRDDVIALCQSLGFIVNYLTDKRDKYSTGECYVLSIQCKKEVKSKVFYLSRKKKKAIEYAENNNRCEKKDYNPIIDIEVLDQYEDMTCFTVDNEESLFLVGDYIVTHNTRTMLADACTLACDKFWANEEKGWVPMGIKQPTLFISTELELSEVQTMALAFISGVNEEHILTGKYDFGERERVIIAAEIIQESPLVVEELPDFSLRDIENTIKRNIRMHHCQYVILDYIHTSMKILEEITSRSGGTKIREDNVLFLLSVRLKDLCNEFGVFLLSGTQLNGSYTTSDHPDQNLLRGAKSIADKIDAGMILLGTTQEDVEALDPIIKSKGLGVPNVKMSVYKNRRGKYNNIYCWMQADHSTCRFKTLFVTDFNYKLLNIEETEIIVQDGGDSYAIQ